MWNIKIDYSAHINVKCVNCNMFISWDSCINLYKWKYGLTFYQIKNKFNLNLNSILFYIIIRALQTTYPPYFMLFIFIYYTSLKNKTAPNMAPLWFSFAHVLHSSGYVSHKFASWMMKYKHSALFWIYSRIKI